MTSFGKTVQCAILLLTTLVLVSSQVNPELLPAIERLEFIARQLQKAFEAKEMGPVLVKNYRPNVEISTK